MEKGSNYLSAVEGVLRGFIITVILLLIFAVIMTFVDIGSRVRYIFYVITNILSIMYGVIYAVRRIGKKGWLVGIGVTLLYLLILYVVSIISGNSAAISSYGVKQLLLDLIVGALSGMIAINL
ncbi:TIGR04086 family membrane protein [Clostridium ljungdahlii]|uniref:TIGR04086 family membrane protein n=1 Tax=Clostridium ljungdahlii TaxID=1538 RepID=UPI003864B733